MEKDYFKINESDEKENLYNSYKVKLTVSEIEALDKCRIRFDYLLKKQKNARSSIIKLIIENTYLYLNNSERFFHQDLESILGKKYYSNIDKSFVKRIKEGNKEYDFILELVRNQLLRIISNREVSEEIKEVQFRLAKDDDNMLRIIAGNKCLTFDEFFSGYLRYFLALPLDTQKYILTYPKSIKLDRAIKEHRCIIINGIKYKPYKYGVGRGLLKTKCLLCFDAIFDSFNEIPNIGRPNITSILDLDIEFTEELFEFTSYEHEVINAYNNLEFIDVSFKLLNNDNKDINKLVDDDFNHYFIIDRKHEYPLEKLKIKYNDAIIRTLHNAEKKNIDYLCFSDNYNEFIKLTMDKQIELKNYIKNTFMRTNK